MGNTRGYLSPAAVRLAARELFAASGNDAQEALGENQTAGVETVAKYVEIQIW